MTIHIFKKKLKSSNDEAPITELVASNFSKTKDAEEKIEKIISEQGYKFSGQNDEHGYWWGCEEKGGYPRDHFFTGGDDTIKKYKL